MGFYPTPRPPDRSYRKLEVRVKGNYIVHFRKGYYTAGPAE
jgi:hypothetical protein